MIIIEAFQVFKEDNGSYTASLNFIDDSTGKVIRPVTVTEYNLDGFKDRIREYKVKIEETETEKQSLLAIVQQAIDEVMAE